MTWRILKHKFVLPFLGIYEIAPRFILVSPYMRNGTLDQWRKQTNPSIADVEKRVWLSSSNCSLMLTMSWKILQVAKGLEYIHSEGIVHGYIHGVSHLNIQHVKILTLCFREMFFWMITSTSKLLALDQRIPQQRKMPHPCQDLSPSILQHQSCLESWMMTTTPSPMFL